MTLLDRRPVAVARTIELDELETFLYRACDDIGELSALRSRTGDALPERAVGNGEVEAALASLVERHLMVCDGERYLSLALAAPASR